MGKGAKGIVLEFGRGPDEGEDDWGEGEDDYPEPEEQRPARDPHALIDGIDKQLQELRTCIADMDY